MNVLRALARQPAVHFLILGAVLLTTQRSLEPYLFRETLIVSSVDLARLRHGWVLDMNREPSDAELAASLRLWLDDEMLLRDALRLELDRTDPVVRRRLLMNLRFALPQTTQDDAALLREARALGMTTRDVVARRRLIELMERRLLDATQLTDAEIQEHVDTHPQRYAHAARLDLDHVFFSRDQRSDAAADARFCSERRQRDTQAVCAADGFLMGNVFTAQSCSDLARMFGAAVAGQIESLPPGRWSSPIESPYGWHLFRVTAQYAASPQDYAQVRPRAAYALLAEKDRQQLRNQVVALRSRYAVELPPEYAGGLPP